MSWHLSWHRTTIRVGLPIPQPIPQPIPHTLTAPELRTALAVFAVTKTQRWPTRPAALPTPATVRHYRTALYSLWTACTFELNGLIFRCNKGDQDAGQRIEAQAGKRRAWNAAERTPESRAVPGRQAAEAWPDVLVRSEHSPPGEVCVVPQAVSGRLDRAPRRLRARAQRGREPWRGTRD